LPHVGHLKEVFHMFAYLKAHHNTEMVFNPTPWSLTATCLRDKIGHFLHTVMKGYQRRCQMACQLLMAHR
jgi:hypothetical protein